uniref:Uncharacterized protein n=1 Tax=Takifugu rubripes TaxID=31033 RepID=A0A674MW91_TAKRU
MYAVCFVIRCRHWLPLLLNDNLNSLRELLAQLLQNRVWEQYWSVCWRK